MNTSKFIRTLIVISILLFAGRALADGALLGDVCDIRPDLCSDDPAAIAKTKALRKKRLQEQKLQHEREVKERAQQAAATQSRAPASASAPVYYDSPIDEVEPLPSEKPQAKGVASTSGNSAPTAKKVCRNAGESFNLDADLPLCTGEQRRQAAQSAKAAPAAATAQPAAVAPAPASAPVARTVHVKPARKIVSAPPSDELSLEEELQKPIPPRVAAKEKTDKEKDKAKREPAAVKLKDSISFSDYEKDNSNNPALAHGMYTEQTAFEYPSTIISTPIGNVQIKSDPIAAPASFATPTTSAGVSLPPQQITPAAAPQVGGDASSNGQSLREGTEAPAPGGNSNNR